MKASDIALSSSQRKFCSKSTSSKSKKQADKCKTKTKMIMESDQLLHEFDRYFNQLNKTEATPGKDRCCEAACHRATSFASLSVINKSLNRSSDEQANIPSVSPFVKAAEGYPVGVKHKLFEKNIAKENAIAKSFLLTQPLTTTAHKSQQDTLINDTHSLQKELNAVIEVLHCAVSDIMVDHQATVYQFVTDQHDLNFKKCKKGSKNGSRFFGKYSYLILLPRNLFRAFKKSIWHKKHSMISYA